MSDAPRRAAGAPSFLARMFIAVGDTIYHWRDALVDNIRFIGGSVYLLSDIGHWLVRSLFTRGVRLGTANLWAQMVRVGIRSIPIIVAVQIFIGIILALQMAPTLQSYGQIQR